MQQKASLINHLVSAGEHGGERRLHCSSGKGPPDWRPRLSAARSELVPRDWWDLGSKSGHGVAVDLQRPG